MIGRSRGAVLLARQSRSQDEIAERIGVSRVMVSKWINGHSTPRPAKRDEIMAAYDIPSTAWEEPDRAAPSAPAPAPIAEIPSGIVPKAMRLEQMCERLMHEVMTDTEATPLEQSKVMRNCSATLRELAELTEVWIRFEKAVAEALEPFPAAAQAVRVRFARVNSQ